MLNVPDHKKNVNTKGGVQTLTEAEQRGATLMFHLLKEFLRERQTMPISNAYAFLLVAQEEGLSVQEYAKRADMGQTSMTRLLFDIGSHTRTRDPGLGLVMQRSDPNDLRRHQTFLTDKGRALIRRINSLLKLKSG